MNEGARVVVGGGGGGGASPNEENSTWVGAGVGVARNIGGGGRWSLPAARACSVWEESETRKKKG